jgi:NAD(P)-dependent dehydrogenase (short-subunit alcohol dehydrogenase family)
VLWETPEIYNRIKPMIPMGRMALPEELSGLALYLASDAASFTTGAVFYVDGGQLAGRGL